MKHALAGLLLLAASPALADTLTVHVDGIREAKGTIRIALCDRSFDVAGCPYGLVKDAVVPGIEVWFAGLRPGSYALAVYQDVDGNGELDRNALGLPTEPYGFSNDIGRLGPPRFAQALFRMDGDMAIEVEIRPLFGG